MSAVKPSILILCTGNSCRSQMAEGLFRHYGGVRFDVHSAGTDPADFVGSPAAIIRRFRSVRDELEARIKGWLATNP